MSPSTIVAGAEPPATATRRTTKEINVLLGQLSRDGFIRAAEARAAGVSERALADRVRNGLLVRERRGRYRFAHVDLNEPTARYLSALELHHAPAIVLWSANHHLGIERERPMSVHVAASKRRTIRSPQRSESHRLRALEADELTVHERVPTTTAARTLRDFAAVLSADDWTRDYVNRWVEEALMLKLMTFDDLERVRERERAPQVRGRLGRLVDFHEGRGTEDVKSRGELWLRDLLERHGFPPARFNVRVPGTNRDADAYLEQIPLIIEFESFSYHRTRLKLARDARRDRTTLRQGIPTFRVTYEDLTTHRQQLDDDLLWVLRGGLTELIATRGGGR